VIDLTQCLAGVLADRRPFYRVDDPYYGACYTPDPAERVRLLPDGREVVVVPHSARGGQLGATTDRANGTWSNTWIYTRASDAVTSAWEWDGTGEPVGWYRHPWSGRRRPDGTPASEIIQP
jgi:hypothetical protein